MNTSKKKKAFTLTELLVVIVIAGVLAAVALPKFNAVVETRRTGEAEELASAIRNEQERRCALDQSYSVHPNQIGVAGVNTANATFNKGSFEYTLNETGLIARRTDKDYKLVMPSYKDGRMYCEGEYCAKLNKNYPQSLTDLREAEECAAPIGEEGGQTACEQDPNSCECNPNQAKCCKADEYWNGTKCVKDTPCNRDPSSCECNPNQAKCCQADEYWDGTKCVKDTPCNRDPNSCECNPNQEKCCDLLTEVWNGENCEPKTCSEDTKPSSTVACGCLNKGTKTCKVSCVNTNTQLGTVESGETYNSLTIQTGASSVNTINNSNHTEYEFIGTKNPAVTLPNWKWKLSDCGECSVPEKCTCEEEPNTSNCCSTAEISAGKTWNSAKKSCECPSNKPYDEKSGKCKAPVITCFTDINWLSHTATVYSHYHAGEDMPYWKYGDYNDQERINCGIVGGSYNFLATSCKSGQPCECIPGKKYLVATYTALKSLERQEGKCLSYSGAYCATCGEVSTAAQCGTWKNMNGQPADSGGGGTVSIKPAGDPTAPCDGC